MSLPKSTNEDFEKVLEFLRVIRGFDFSAYKRTTLQRRIQKRMDALGLQGYPELQAHLEKNPDEFQFLFNTILINVTAFFRDREAWDYIAGEVVPALLAQKDPDSSLRFWVAGCASGEEAYSLAMVLAEAMGITPFRERVKIYATDVDEDALSSGRVATYSESDVSAVPDALREKYFECVGARLLIDRDLRRGVIFGRHDLISDAPISRIDLLLCRNTLMYFNGEAQDRILSRFHFALADGGILFLGKAETLLTHASIFAPIDLKNRIFYKIPRPKQRDLALPAMLPPTAGRRDPTPNGRLRESAFENGASAQIILHRDGRVSDINGKARKMFSLGAGDIGRPFYELNVSYRPAELRTGIEQAVLMRRIVEHKRVPWTMPDGDNLVFDITVTPLTTDVTNIVGTSITFEDVTKYKSLQEELLNFNQELETAYEEVQSTNEELQTTNEELQSTVEEMETTNEELQSTNEELETMNEELQSANEELETINDELRMRSMELDRVNSFLESILAGLRDGVIVVDSEMRILAWNTCSEELWGLRGDETVGKHLLNLDIGLPVDKLRQPIRLCLSQAEMQDVEIDAMNRRGRGLRCHLVFTPLRGPDGETRGVIILVESVMPLAES